MTSININGIEEKDFEAVPGDVNGDGKVNISDVTTLIGLLLSDVTGLINYLLSH